MIVDCFPVPVINHTKSSLLLLMYFGIRGNYYAARCAFIQILILRLFECPADNIDMVIFLLIIFVLFYRVSIFDGNFFYIIFLEVKNVSLMYSCVLKLYGKLSQFMIKDLPTLKFSNQTIVTERPTTANEQVNATK